jgi:hypothetical protein
MSRVFLDGSDDISEETIRELLDRSFPGEHTLREILQEIQI